MRKPLVVAAALVFSGPALAKKKGVSPDGNGIRAKLSQDFFGRQSDWQIVDGDPGDKTYTDSLTFLNGAGRLEVTKLIGKGLEIGGMASYTFTDQKTDDDGIAAGQAYSIGLTGSYNFKLGDNTKGFVQPMLGYGRQGLTPEGGDEAAETQLFFGGAAGVRVRLFKRVTFDPQLEYTQRNLTYFADGKEVEAVVEGNEVEVDGRRTNVGLRWGLTVML